MSDCTWSERLKWWSGGSLIVASPSLIYAACSFYSGQPSTGWTALYAAAGAILLYLFIVCFVFPDEFIEMGIIPVLILSILFVILYPVFLQARQKAQRRHNPQVQTSQRKL